MGITLKSYVSFDAQCILNIQYNTFKIIQKPRLPRVSFLSFFLCPLFFYQKRRNTSCMRKFLIESSDFLDFKLTPLLQNNHRSTPLLMAAEYGQLEGVELLVDKGADRSKRDNHGDTVLHATAYGYVLSILISSIT